MGLRERGLMEKKVYRFQALIEPVPKKGGAFVRFPYDIRQEFGKGRVKVAAPLTGNLNRAAL